MHAGSAPRHGQSRVVALIYRLFFRLVLRRLDAERAHDLAVTLLGRAGRVRPIRRLLRRVLAPTDPVLRVRALGLTFPSPLGVAAGMDKNADWFEGLGAIGFGFVEVGTVTAGDQDGAAKPRIERLEETAGLLNWMGFPNAGAKTIARKLAGPHETIVGVNVGKSKAIPIQEAGGDYRAAVRQLGPCADYLVLNVSSPNTPGLREMQATELLRRLVAEVRDELDDLDLRVPLLVKIGPDLSDRELDDVADAALELSLDGLIAVNSTVDRRGFVSRLIGPDDPAGLSGAPLTQRALEVLQRLRSRVGDRLPLVAVGGIQTPADALDRILAGATLVQGYSGFVYGGPLWPWRVNRTLARFARNSGASSIEDVVGADAPNGRREGHAATSGCSSPRPDAASVVAGGARRRV